MNNFFGILAANKNHNASSLERKKPQLQTIIILISLILITVFFSLTSDNFLTSTNIIGILLSTTINSLLAIGATYMIITGGIDLSLGTSMTLSAVMTGIFIVQWEIPLPIGILMGILVGLMIGCFNGIMITKMHLPPFIATLGTQMATKGLSIVLTDGTPIYFTDYPIFKTITSGSIIADMFEKIGIKFIRIPNGVLIMFIVAVVAGIVLGKTKLGRYLYAIGSNEEATRLSGVKVEKWKLIAYMIGGVMSGSAGVLISSRLNSAQPSLGVGYEMDAVAACVIGGASLAGGEGSIFGTIIGAFIISVLTNGLRIMSVPTEWQTVVTGLIIIGAVFADIIRKRR
ncbi:MAG: ABC transporter permease [Anaerolineaceae bacterium]|jgi:ribose transport system permease protein